MLCFIDAGDLLSPGWRLEEEGIGGWEQRGDGEEGLGGEREEATAVL